MAAATQAKQTNGNGNLTRMLVQIIQVLLLLGVGAGTVVNARTSTDTNTTATDTKVDVGILKKAVSGLEKQNERLTETVYRQADAIRDRQSTERAFSEMGARLTTVESEFRKHTHDQAGVEQRLARLEERAKAIEERLKAMEAK